MLCGTFKNLSNCRDLQLRGEIVMNTDRYKLGI